MNLLEIHIRQITCGCGYIASSLDRERAASMMLDHIVHRHCDLRPADPISDTESIDDATDH